MNRKTYLLVTNWKRILLKKMRNDSNRLKNISILSSRKIIAIALKKNSAQLSLPCEPTGLISK